MDQLSVNLCYLDVSYNEPCAASPRSDYRVSHGAVGVPQRCCNPSCARVRSREPNASRASKGLHVMMTLRIIVWLLCSLPVAVLIGYCTLNEGDRCGDIRGAEDVQ
jgi:hypothetical protein